MAEQLGRQGWVVLERNWHGRGGELDLIVERHGCLRFVEVKERQVGDPVGLEAVDSYKQRKLARTAEAWLAGYDGDFVEACFMVAMVEPSGEGWVIEIIDDAFDVP